MAVLPRLKSLELMDPNSKFKLKKRPEVPNEIKRKKKSKKMMAVPQTSFYEEHLLCSARKKHGGK